MVRKIALISSILAAILIVYAVFLIGSMLSQMPLDTRLGKDLTVSMLYETDHKALLDACRKVLKESELGKWKKEFRYNIRSEPHPDVHKLPKEILDTNPMFMTIKDNILMIELMSGPNHVGFWAYSEDFEIPFSGYEYEDKMLIEGLWFTDDGYHVVENYDEYIESLKPI